jgi:4-hydroxy-3-methylbut-2-enyl diphosphate reductase
MSDIRSKFRFITKISDFHEVAERQHSSYGSDFVKKMIDNNGLYRSDKTGVIYQIPTHFGFCYGVEKSIDMAFETWRQFQDKRIYLTHDIIHNPRVNQDLLEKGMKVLKRDNDNQLILDDLTSEDVVIIAAFGCKFTDVERLQKKGCIVVDTACGAIVVVWKRVEQYAKNGFTSVIHGIWNHEETQAIASQALKYKGHFLIIRDLEEARKIESVLKKEMSARNFMSFFKNRMSPNFDPDIHLTRIGIASQTTLLRSETQEIQEYLQKLFMSFVKKDDQTNLFMSYDTICSATQERQDALKFLMKQNPDIMIIIGGFNSSNTTHLSEIASEQFTTVHIRGPEDILSKSKIRHLCPKRLEETQTHDWIPSSLKRICISTGASTPDLSIENVIMRMESCLK